MPQQNERKTWTLAAACKVLDDPRATPADIRAAQSWNAITPGAALAWLRGWNAGLKANGAPPVKLDRVA